MYNQQLQQIELNPETYPILFQDNNKGKENRYLHIKTIEPVNVLMESGWLPRQVVEIRPRKNENKGFNKHRVRFFNPNMPVVNGSHVELLLTNSYDCTTSFQLQLGVFRVVCANGLVTGESYATQAVRHLGYSNDIFYNAIKNITPQSERVIDQIDRFSGIKIDSAEKYLFGKSILEMRLDTESEENSEGGKWILDDYSVQNVFAARRYSDNGDDLWTTMNRAQENICRHGFYATKQDERGYKQRTKVRGIKNAFSSDRLNKAIWTLTEGMYQLKTGGSMVAA